MLFDASLVLLATFSASTFYVASQREIFRSWSDSLKYLPFLMSVGVGVSLNNARAALEGLLGRSSEFVRTPKFGMSARSGPAWKVRSRKNRLGIKRAQAWCELAMALYMTGCVLYTVYLKIWIGLFFMCLFMVGYYYVAGLTFYGDYLASRTTGE